MTFLFFRSDKPVYTTTSFRHINPCQPTQAIARPVLSYLWNPQSAHQHFGAQGGNFGPLSLSFSLRGHQLMIATDKHYSCSVYRQTGWDPFPYPVTSSSGSVPMATNSRHSHPGQTHSGLSKHDRSRGPPVLAKPAHNNRVESPPRNSDPDLRNVGNSNSGHVCHSPQYDLPRFMSPIPEPRALGLDAL